jgi:2-keto-4-pentenoate hydratase/2-oxohepta-3-ene-1,7-dioic acid hydratase in catechol pathway
MRLITYKTAWGTRSAIAVGETAVDTARAATRCGFDGADAAWRSNRALAGLGATVLEQLAGAAEAIAAAEPGTHGVTALADLVLGPPITDPDKIICLGLNYKDHAEEAGLALPTSPMLFAKYRNSLTGPTSPIELPSGSEAVDYEAELAIVIGRRGKDVAEADALDHVAGAMVLNDVSARDLQHATSQWLAGKAIDTFAPCGPALVTLDEIDDLQDLAIEARVNGRTVQQANTSLMIFPVAETIAYISSLMTLEPGDIIATGTPAGVGFKRDPQVLLGDGDLVEVEIQGVGAIANPVHGARRAPSAAVAETTAAV